MLIDLYKADGIREEINYHDKCIFSNVFQWQSPNNIIQDSIPELPADLYNDFITDVNKTKIGERK